MNIQPPSTPSESVETVLLAKVSGNVRLHEALGADETQWAIDRCIKRMERSAEASGGRVTQQIGCELMATFSAADDALRAALDMQQRIDDLPPVSGVKLQISVAFAHGCTQAENGEYSGDALKIAATLAGVADPGEILTETQTQEALSARFRQLTRIRGAFPASSRFGQSRICEVLSAPPQTPAAADPGLARYAGARLLLGYNDQVFTLDEARPSLRLGRDADNDLVIKSHRISRHHAVIEKRGKGFVLIDTSTNGSYLCPEGVPETSLRRGECLIHGKGMISLASHATDQDADILVYELQGG